MYYVNWMIMPPILPIKEKVVLSSSEHADVIETETIIFYLCDVHHNMHIIQYLSSSKFSSKLSPCSRVETIKYSADFFILVRFTSRQAGERLTNEKRHYCRMSAGKDEIYSR